ncbi:class I SAM-dependent methyltransferase [Danxiaibacter flavus]|uniref:Class I SAM-dependent methyltransferase n=1 Tax=Danxiaibacter flavus TaxID=3049108 RepID=A0ABV3ZJG8_9BACT|nr:class I SAM-dependent methyltransferase [Chitinophagaceae bacterium DXS]
MLKKIATYLLPGADVKEENNLLVTPIDPNRSKTFWANSYYFNHPEWAEEYLFYCHRSDEFIGRWKAAVGDWSNKIVLDIGCGPGNIFASLQGTPKLLIGVDIAPKSLEMAAKMGYTPLLADAANLPFKSGFADVVALNAALHHCDDMETVLREAARLVKPGGLLVTDHDPQLSAWNYKGLAKLLWNSRLIWYKIIGHGFHKTTNQQYWGLACETHHKPGDGVTKELFKNTLETKGFSVRVFPHNHNIGAEILQGKKDKAAFKYRLGNVLSGRNPNSEKSALSLMCVAKKSATYNEPAFE